MSDLDEIRDKADSAFAELEELTATLKATTRPSKAAYILGEARDDVAAADLFFHAVAMARSRDYEEQRVGKAALEAMGSRWGDSSQKAVLGDSGGAGGYLVPRNIVQEMTEVSVIASPIRQLFTTITGVTNTAAVELPLEGPAPVRAVIASRGSTKENSSFTTSNYSATFYTIARIIDVGNQLLTQSAGAAEKVTRSRLARAFSLGETYYTLSGSGTGEPMGVLTSIAASGGFTTAHTASDSTVAGSVRAAVAKAIEALAARGREADGVLMNPGDLAHAMVQGSDNGGFWVDSGGGSVGLIGLPGIRIFTSTAVTSKTAIAGEWKSANFYVGAEYRVDVSSEAGDRWDKNLTGFRAEEDIAFNADPYVAAGMFQRITGLIP